jgi:protein dithiol oxidoreductase (disulfide-forming)
MTSRRTFLIAASMSAVAVCAAEPATGDAQSLGSWRAGQHYRLLEFPQPTAVAAGKVEVLEAFWYGCSHCDALDPVLEDWKAKKPEFVEFSRMPVVWGPMHRQHAKLFYALQALGKPELHAKVFDAIHRGGNPLAAQDELKGRAMQLEFLSSHGVTEQAFDAAYDSMTVSVNVRRAQTLTHRLAVDSVPLIFINGKYVTSLNEAGGNAELLQLINDLAGREQPR